jgi:hypothetical protein
LSDLRRQYLLLKRLLLIRLIIGRKASCSKTKTYGFYSSWNAGKIMALFEVTFLKKREG